jgi:hypothetical protein
MVIDGFFLGGYWWLFCQWLLVPIILMVINNYFTGGYWLLFY